MDNSKPLISIIVPVYNVEDYLPECIDSILAQTYKNLEIILVNDGSTDNSGKICDEYAQKDSRIKVIHKENSGVSSTRNMGIEAASGEYIGFVDSDDTVDSDMYTIMYDAAFKTNSDISVCKFIRFSASAHAAPDKHNYEDTFVTMTNTEAIACVLVSRPFSGSICDKLFKAEIIKNARLDTRLHVAEDFLFTVTAMAKSKRATFVPIMLYNYRVRKTSVSHEVYSPKKLESFEARVAAEKILREHGLYEELKDEMDASFVASTTKIIRGLCTDKELFKKYKAFAIKEFKKHSTRKSRRLISKSLKKHTMLINFNVYFYYMIQRLRHRR